MRVWCHLAGDHEAAPPEGLHRPRRIQLMTLLSFIWTVVSCLAFSARLRLDALIPGHLAVPDGIAVTGMTFHRSRRDGGPGPAIGSRRARR